MASLSVRDGRSKGHSLEYMQRAAEMVKLRSGGVTTQAIAEQYGVTTRTVTESIKAAVAAVPYEAVTEMRALQLDSLNLLKRRVLRALLVDHPKVDHGHVVTRTVIQEDGTRKTVEVVDWDIAIRASAELRKIEDSISRLTGTRAPVVHEVHEISEDALDAAIAELTESIRLRAAEFDDPIDVDAWDDEETFALQVGEDAAASTAAGAG